MKKKPIRVLLFSCILFFYALLYIATSPNKPELECGTTCEKLASVDTLLRKKPNVVNTSINRFYTSVGVEPKDSIFSIYVKDSLQSDWNGLADTACLYMNNVMLFQYKIKIIQTHNGRTVAEKTCP